MQVSPLGSWIKCLPGTPRIAGFNVWGVALINQASRISDYVVAEWL